MGSLITRAFAIGRRVVATAADAMFGTDAYVPVFRAGATGAGFPGAGR